MKRFLNQLGVGPRQIVRIDALARLDRIPTTNTSRAPPTNGNAPGATKPCPTCLPISARLRPNTTSNTARRRRAEPPSPRTSTAWQSNVGCTRPTSGRTAKHGPSIFANSPRMRYLRRSSSTWLRYMAPRICQQGTQRRPGARQCGCELGKIVGVSGSCFKLQTPEDRTLGRHKEELLSEWRTARQLCIDEISMVPAAVLALHLLPLPQSALPSPKRVDRACSPAA